MLIGACNSMIYLIHVFRHGQGAVEDPASDGFYIFGGCRHVRLAAAGMASLTTAALWQVARGGKLSLPGMARLDMETPAVAATAAGGFAIVWSFGAVALTPALARGEALERTKQA